MSVVIIVGSGGHEAIDRAVKLSPNLSPEDLAALQNLIDSSAAVLNAYCAFLERKVNP